MVRPSRTWFSPSLEKSALIWEPLDLSRGQNCYGNTLLGAGWSVLHPHGIHIRRRRVVHLGPSASVLRPLEYATFSVSDSRSPRDSSAPAFAHCAVKRKARRSAEGLAAGLARTGRARVAAPAGIRRFIRKECRKGPTMALNLHSEDTARQKSHLATALRFAHIRPSCGPHDPCRMGAVCDLTCMVRFPELSRSQGPSLETRHVWAID
jgi:hypothetical protein